MQRIVTFKIDSRLLWLLDRYARRKKMTRSEVIREAIVKLLKSEGINVEEYVKPVEEPRRTDVPVIEVPV
jgi:metal-responsive CopG/Arc/MetJ family transcriptional regulator